MASGPLAVEANGHAPIRLREIAEKLKGGTSYEPCTVRELLAFFGYQRRGFWVKGLVRRTLKDLGITTIPDFAYEWIDSEIHLVLATDASPPVIGPSGGELQNLAELLAVATEEIVLGVPVDPTYRIGKLPAANQQLVSVTLDDDIALAVTEMMKGDFSQLPIIHGDRDVKGIVTWASIGSRLALGVPCQKVRDCRAPHREVRADSSLFQAIPAIVEFGYVLVRGNDNRITGIVTASDLSLQFQQLAEPFLLLGEVEQHIRSLIDGKFNKSDLQSAKDTTDDERAIERVSDLTLGECQRLLERPENWSKLKLGIDRAAFVQELNRVRIIRNDVMHFDPDPFPESDLQTLRKFVRFLQRLQEMRPSGSLSSASASV